MLLVNQHNSGNADVVFIQTNSSVTAYNTVYITTTTLTSSYPASYGIETVVYKNSNFTLHTKYGIIDIG